MQTTVYGFRSWNNTAHYRCACAGCRRVISLSVPYIRSGNRYFCTAEHFLEWSFDIFPRKIAMDVQRELFE